MHYINYNTYVLHTFKQCTIKDTYYDCYTQSEKKIFKIILC